MALGFPSLVKGEGNETENLLRLFSFSRIRLSSHPALPRLGLPDPLLSYFLVIFYWVVFKPT
jgi:hypothetical protein